MSNILYFFCLPDLLRVFFFFFQAEDGIRDLTVTGVQTCALPIFSDRAPTPFELARRWDLSCARRHRSRIAAPGFLRSRRFPAESALTLFPSSNNRDRKSVV